MKSREFKFRAFHPEWKKFIYFAPMKLFGNIGGFQLETPNNKDLPFHCFNSADVILQQWTGLLDVNEKEVFEGDFIRVTDNNLYALCNKMTNPLGLLEWIREGFEVKSFDGCFRLSDLISCDCCPAQIEVIGNILENPEIKERVYSNE